MNVPNNSLGWQPAWFLVFDPFFTYTRRSSSSHLLMLTHQRHFESVFLQSLSSWIQAECLRFVKPDQDYRLIKVENLHHSLHHRSITSNEDYTKVPISARVPRMFHQLWDLYGACLSSNYWFKSKQPLEPLDKPTSKPTMNPTIKPPENPT